MLSNRFIKEVSKIILDPHKFEIHADLISKENKYVEKFHYNNIDNIENMKVRNFLSLTSIPFVIGDCDANLRDIWFTDCNKCDNIECEKVLPTGNLKPKYIVIGEAPSDYGDYSVYGDSIPRAWVHGNTSNILRGAMTKLKFHYYTWYTNAIKCKLPGNRNPNEDEIDKCSEPLFWELYNLCGDDYLIFTLGKSTAKIVDSYNIKYDVVNLYHPAYFAYRGKDYINYSKHIVKRLKKEGQI